MGIRHEPGAIPNEPGAIFEMQFRVARKQQCKDTNRQFFFEIFIMKISKITPE